MHTVTSPSNEAPARAESRPGKYLTFSSGTQEFAVPVAKVREIIELPRVTAVPHTPSFVSGVINLRGKVVPVIHLRAKLGDACGTETRPRACVIVFQAESVHGTFLIGVIVDSVSEVVAVPAGDMEATESFGHGLVHSAYLHGVAKIRGRVTILLNVDRVLSPSERASLEQAEAVS